MDSRICQTFAVSPAEPGDYPLYLTSQGIENSVITKIPNFSNVEPVAEVKKNILLFLSPMAGWFPKKDSMI